MNNRVPSDLERFWNKRTKGTGGSSSRSAGHSQIIVQRSVVPHRLRGCEGVLIPCRSQPTTNAPAGSWKPTSRLELAAIELRPILLHADLALCPAQQGIAG